MIPKHVNPTNSNRTATAPYNFVQLPEQIVGAETPVPDQDIFSHKTGYIDCKLKTLTPTYTRTAFDPAFFANWAKKLDQIMKNREAVKTYAQFFHLDDMNRPVIPGSSLRGMLRTLVEIAGYGKMQWVTDEKMVFREVGGTSSIGNSYRQKLMEQITDKSSIPRIKAGYIKKKGSDYVIVPAKKINGATFARVLKDKYKKLDLQPWHKIHNAKKLWVDIGDYKFQNVRGGFITMKFIPVTRVSATQQSDMIAGVLAESGPIDKKKYETVVFPEDKSAKHIPISDELVKRYMDQVTQQQIKLLGSDKGVLQDNQPVMYLTAGNKLVFFGHCMMFRLPYPKSPLDFVPKQLRMEEELDISEAVFGYIHGKKQRAGRVFVTDAICDAGQENIWEPIIKPKILSSPKPTSFQHYLTQSTDVKNKLNNYNSATPGDTVLRGHKAYWHKGHVSRNDYAELDDQEHETQYTRIKPVKSNVTFSFRVYFENLTDVELGALLWCLALPEGHHHKIGMGKPLGMGSVSIEPKLTLSNRKDRYSRLFDQTKAWHTAETKDQIRHYKRTFENYILQHISREEKHGARTLTDLDRIKDLLALLQWPGPDKSETQYMNLDRFRHRPVLPDAQFPEQRVIDGGRGSGSDKPNGPDEPDPEFEPGDVIEITIGEAKPKDGHVAIEISEKSLCKLRISRNRFKRIDPSQPINARIEKRKWLPRRNVHLYTVRMVDR